MGRTRKYTQTTKLIETNKTMPTNNNQNDKSYENNKNTLNYEEIENNIIDICNFKKKEKMLYDVLNDFFVKCNEKEIETIIDIINGKYKISLRFLDWFVTRYCYLYKTSIQINNKYNKEQDFNINISYKAQLKSFKKKCFDPFKRKNKFYYSFAKNVMNYSILTTLGQLNFFKWAISFDIIKYVEDNFDTINNKINYVNSFFKKNIIDNNTSSLIYSDELNSKLSNISNTSNTSNVSNTSAISNTSTISNLPNTKDLLNTSNKYNSSNSNTENNLSPNMSKKKAQSYNPIVSRKIFVEL